MDDYIILKNKNKFKAIFSEELRGQIKTFGVCLDCKGPNTTFAWCSKCDPGKFLKEGKTSGNPEIDILIYESQLQTKDYDKNLEWIPFDRFQDIKSIGEGGFANIFSAIWLDGEPAFGLKTKMRTGPIKVALKKLKNPKNMEAFINEIKIHNECSNNPYFTKFYGITKDPKTGEFMMILEYAENGNLREYLKKNRPNLKWGEKLIFLDNIASNLTVIHDNYYVHKDLHSGNILQFNKNYIKHTKITDLGLAQLINNSKSSNCSSVCGVLPYIAPEVLDGRPYTHASDVYSFGIIMIEVSTGIPPYGSVPHDEKLALAICNGLRPRVAKGTPRCYIDLVNQCLDANPRKRPSVEELRGIIRNWFRKTVGNVKVSEEFIDAEEIISQEITINPEAIYTSRFMSFTNLSKPINSTRVQIEDPGVSDSQLIDLHVSDKFRNSLEGLIESINKIGLSN